MAFDLRDPRDRSRTVDKKCPCHGYNVCPDNSGVVTQPKVYVRCERCRLVLPRTALLFHELDGSCLLGSNGFVLCC